MSSGWVVNRDDNIATMSAATLGSRPTIAKQTLCRRHLARIRRPVIFDNRQPQTDAGWYSPLLAKSWRKRPFVVSRRHAMASEWRLPYRKRLENAKRTGVQRTLSFINTMRVMPCCRSSYNARHDLIVGRQLQPEIILPETVYVYTNINITAAATATDTDSCIQYTTPAYSLLLNREHRWCKSATQTIISRAPALTEMFKIFFVGGYFHDVCAWTTFLWLYLVCRWHTSSVGHSLWLVTHAAMLDISLCFRVGPRHNKSID